MSNPDHVAKLLEGIAAWNEWRANNPEAVPDLRDAALAGNSEIPQSSEDEPLDLSAALLKRADLTGCVLKGANLASADLREANLSEATLVGADLSFANLENARLDQTDLSGAQFAGALIPGARLHFASNLTQAQIDVAQGDEKTVLPPGMTMPETWREPLALAAEAERDDALSSDRLGFDPFAVLEIERKAKMIEVRAAYLRLAKRYHPDLNLGDETAEQHFKQVNAAYRLLVARDKIRQQRRRQRETTPWAVAAGLVIVAFVVPGALVYSLDVPALVARLGQPFRTTQPDQQHITALVGVTGPAKVAALEATEKVEPAAKVIAAQTAGEPLLAPPAPGEEKKPVMKPQEDVSDRVNTAVTLPNTPPPAVTAKAADAAPPAAAHEKREIEAVPVSTTTPLKDDSDGPASPKPIPPADGSQPQQLAALQEPPLEPAEVVEPPWIKEWIELRGSIDLRALQAFISRFSEKKEADYARIRFRALLAAVNRAEELQRLIRDAPDTSETALAKKRLARLIEQANSRADEHAWREAQTADTAAAYRAYLANFRDGQFEDEAEDRLAAIEDAMSDQKEEATWVRARREGTRAAIQAYLSAHPRGRYHSEARRRRAAIEANPAAAQREDDLWAKAKAENTHGGYRRYLSTYPRGRYASLARRAARRAAGVPGANTEATTAPSNSSDAPPGALPWPFLDEPFVELLPPPN